MISIPVALSLASVLNAYSNQLERIFKQYGILLQDKNHYGMDWNRFRHFAAAFQLFPELVPMHELNSMFKTSIVNDRSHMQYDDFVLCLGRCALYAFSGQEWDFRYPEAADKLRLLFFTMDKSGTIFKDNAYHLAKLLQHQPNSPHRHHGKTIQPIIEDNQDIDQMEGRITNALNTLKNNTSDTVWTVWCPTDKSPEQASPLNQSMDVSKQSLDISKQSMGVSNQSIDVSMQPEDAVHSTFESTATSPPSKAKPLDTFSIDLPPLIENTALLHLASPRITLQEHHATPLKLNHSSSRSELVKNSQGTTKEEQGLQANVAKEASQELKLTNNEGKRHVRRFTPHRLSLDFP